MARSGFGIGRTGKAMIDFGAKFMPEGNKLWRANYGLNPQLNNGDGLFHKARDGHIYY